MSKFPRLGEVNTRLAESIGPENALRLHVASLLDTVERTSRLPARQILLFSGCSKSEAEEFVERNSAARPAIRLQEGGDLGARLLQAHRAVVEDARAVVFLGTDSPTTPVGYIEEAFGSLRRFPVVIGPVPDGGYYLIGLSQLRPEVFADIDWGTSRVFEQTMKKVDRGEVHLLPAWYDVDRIGDLVRLKQELEADRRSESARTLEVLNDLSGF